MFVGVVTGCVMIEWCRDISHMALQRHSFDANIAHAIPRHSLPSPSLSRLFCVSHISRLSLSLVSLLRVSFLSYISQTSSLSLRPLSCRRISLACLVLHGDTTVASASRCQSLSSLSLSLSRVSCVCLMSLVSLSLSLSLSLLPLSCRLSLLRVSCPSCLSFVSLRSQHILCFMSSLMTSDTRSEKR